MEKMIDYENRQCEAIEACKDIFDYLDTFTNAALTEMSKTLIAPQFKR
jgi:hypothetical protein